MTISAETEAAAEKLDELLSQYFNTPFEVPESILRLAECIFSTASLSENKQSCTSDELLDNLPVVVQDRVGSDGLIFGLPFVAAGRGITLTADQSRAVWGLLGPAVDGLTSIIRVPTFFYPDGSAMVIVFNALNLARAISIVRQNPDAIKPFYRKTGGR
jgi:hypothetical protein